MTTKILSRDKEKAEKILKKIAKNGKRIGQSTMYLLDGVRYVLTGNQHKRLGELKNGNP